MTMLSERRKAYLLNNLTKLVSPSHLMRLAKNPSLAYQHVRGFLNDTNFREPSEKQNLDVYKNSVMALSKLCASNGAPFDVWLPMLPDSNSDIQELGALFEQHGSDKSTLHNYHRIYGSILAAKRFGELNILEIGLGSNNLDVPSNMGVWGKPGASLRAFRDWAPKAHIIGADVDRRILFSEPRISTFWVDQTDCTSLDALAERLKDTKFDLIIDDGLHLPHANFNTLYALLRLLDERGIFVVEDIEHSHAPFWQLAQSVLVKYDSYLTEAKGGFIFVARRR